MEKKRYKIGFEEGVQNIYCVRNPDMIPIVDTKGPFFHGVMVCLCAYEDDAQKVVRALNIIDTLEKTWTAD